MLFRSRRVRRIKKSCCSKLAPGPRGIARTIHRRGADARSLDRTDYGAAGSAYWFHRSAKVVRRGAQRSDELLGGAFEPPATGSHDCRLAERQVRSYCPRQCISTMNLQASIRFPARGRRRDSVNGAHVVPRAGRRARRRAKVHVAGVQKHGRVVPCTAREGGSDKGRRIIARATRR